MNKFLLFGCLPLLATCMTGCFDKGYDLADIDTTSEFKVKDLVLPIQMDPVTLGDIINIKEGDQIKTITLNGETFYAVRESGSFSSDPIVIPSFSSPAPVIPPSVIRFGTLTKSSSRAADVVLSLKEPIKRQINYKAENIDPAILSISDLYSSSLNISIGFKADASLSRNLGVKLSNVELSLPKGLTVSDISPSGNYSAADGKLTIASVPFENGEATVSLSASAVNLPANGSTLDYNAHTLDLIADVNIEMASVTLTPEASSISQLPEEVNIDVEYNISALNVEAVSGEIQYMLEGEALNISPINLNNIPDFLAQDQTNLVLANPQIYIKANNPVAGEHLGFQTGLTLTALRENDSPRSFSLDNGYFRVGYDKGINGPYTFCLSPSLPGNNVPSDFQNPSHVAFSSLGDVISGNGIPQQIEIKLDSPQVYRQTVNEFHLGQSLPKLEGNWEFLAPLALKQGSQSQIIYTETKDGWNDPDVDAITIKVLELTMNITSTLPLKAHLTGYPIDTTGHQIQGVSIEGADIPAGAKDYPVKIYITGEVKHLDGITFTATVLPGDSDAPLAPDQTLTLSDIRAKVTGNYIKEL